MKKKHKFDLQLFGDTDTEVILQTGENTANIEQLEEKHEEIAETVEDVKRSQKWTDENFDYVYRRLGELQDEINSMKVKETIEEINEPGIHDETVTEEEELESVIVDPDEEKEEKEEKKASKKSWNPFW